MNQQFEDDDDDDGYAKRQAEMKTIIIDPEFRDLLPPLSEEQLELLHTSITTRGILSPLLVWKGTKILVDGHNRHAFCLGRDILPPPVYEEIYFDAREDALRWIIRNQLGRRNLDPATASNLRGRLYESRKKDVTANLPQNLPKPQNEVLVESLPSNETDGDLTLETEPVILKPTRKATDTTAEQVADETGVSRATIERDALFVRALDKTGTTIGDFKKSKKSKKAIIEEAFPEKKKAKPDEFEPLVVDGTQDDEEDEAIEAVVQSFKALNKSQREKCAVKINYYK